MSITSVTPETKTLQILYEQNRDTPWSLLRFNWLRDEVARQTDLSSDEIQEIFVQMEEDNLIAFESSADEEKGLIDITSEGLEQLSEQADSPVESAEEIAGRILGVLQEETGSDGHPSITAATLVSRLGEATTNDPDLDSGVYYLDKMGYATADTQFGGDHPFYRIERTDEGEDYYMSLGL